MSIKRCDCDDSKYTVNSNYELIILSTARPLVVIFNFSNNLLLQITKRRGRYS